MITSDTGVILLYRFVRDTRAYYARYVRSFLVVKSTPDRLYIYIYIYTVVVPFFFFKRAAGVYCFSEKYPLFVPAVNGGERGGRRVCERFIVSGTPGDSAVRHVFRSFVRFSRRPQF